MFFLDLAQMACLGSGALKEVFIPQLTGIQMVQLWPFLTAHSEPSEHLNSRLRERQTPFHENGEISHSAAGFSYLTQTLVERGL